MNSLDLLMVVSTALAGVGAVAAAMYAMGFRSVLKDRVDHLEGSISEFRKESHAEHEKTEQQLDQLWEKTNDIDRKLSVLTERVQTIRSPRIKDGS